MERKEILKYVEVDQQRGEKRARERVSDGKRTSDGDHVLRSRELARGGCGLNINE